MNLLTEPDLPAQARKWLAVPLLLLFGAVAVFVAYFQYNWPGAWMGGAESLTWRGSELRLMEGSGRAVQENLVIDGVSPGGAAVAFVPQTFFRAEDYLSVKCEIEGAAPGQQIMLLWRRADNPRGFFAQRFVFTGKGAISLPLSRDEKWKGQIVGLALMTQAPLTVKRVELEPFSPVRKLFSDWFGGKPWQGTSINFVGDSDLRQFVSPLPFAAGILALALAGYWALAKRRAIPSDARAAWALVLLAWLLLDMRWQFDLWRKLGSTLQTYAGKSWEQKHLAAGDGPVFGLMQQVRAKLPNDARARVFLFADDDYARGRAAYHLFPHNVLADASLPAADQFKSGDFIIVLGKDEVSFDPERQSLKWAQQELKAELLMLVANNALLKVR